jgi:hypothetical protein
MLMGGRYAVEQFGEWTIPDNASPLHGVIQRRAPGILG